MNRTKALSRGVGSKRAKASVETMNEWLEQQAKKTVYTYTHTAKRGVLMMELPFFAFVSYYSSARKVL